MSKIATDDMVLLPGFVLDEMFRTAQYCMTAHNLAMFADMGDDYSDIIELRYAGNPEMLKFDMEYGPILIERLGRLSDEVEKAPDTHNFIERYIEDVKRFMLDLKRYADSMDGCQ
ncbi:MAG: hypothetical protein JXC85_04160 [Candidatus Aenigmarchaeota archaeon]|nr:hypothetical protein [Candidatus Aenigmarchaeota archaeon]